MATEFLSDKVPMYVYNKHTTYENTVLQEHSAMVSGLRDTAAKEALIEGQSRLLIGMCMKDRAIKFIDENFKKYEKEEFDKAIDEDDSERQNHAFNRAWFRLVSEAMTHCINRYKLDGSKAKIAIIDNMLPDGRMIIDAEDAPVEFTEDQDGV